MNRNFTLFFLTCLFITLFLTPQSSVSAQENPGNNLPLAGQSTISKMENQFLIPLDFPEPEHLQAPAGMNREQAERFSQSITKRAAAPLLSKLDGLMTDGLVKRIELRTDLHAILIETDQVDQVRRLLGEVTLWPGGTDNPPTCLADAGNALREQVLGVSLALAQVESSTRLAVNRIDATNPSIYIYISPYGSYSSVEGQTLANTSVHLRIFHAGRLIADETTFSDGSGWYNFYPSYYSCPTGGYNWLIRPGDTVEVTAGGQTVSTIAARLRLWVDPATEVVAGWTNPGRSVTLYLYALPVNGCSPVEYLQSTVADSSGFFSANFSAQVNVNGRAYAYIDSLDSNQNLTYSSGESFYIATGFETNWIWGYIRPFTDFTATLERSGLIVSSDVGRSTHNGYYDFGFSDLILPGDNISVTATGINLSYTATDLSAFLNPSTDQVSGTTGANRPLVAYFESRGYWEFTNSCSYHSTCTGGTANGAGTFILNAGFDILRGDQVFLEVFDANGNRQDSDQFNAPVISVRPNISSNSIRGLWRDGQAGSLTITHKDGGDVVKWSNSSIYLDYDGYFSTSSGSTIFPGDKIEVFDGINTELMVVPNFNGRLESATNYLTGVAGNGKVVGELYAENGACVELGVSTNSFSFDFGSQGIDINGWDNVDLWNIATDGHITYQYRYAFTVSIQKGGSQVFGYAETQGINVNLELWRGAALISSAMPTSSSTGYYSGSFSGTISENDQVKVTTADGNNVTITIPKLTVNKDSANDIVFGQGPVNSWVVAYAAHTSSPSGASYAGQSVPTDGAGNYSADFTGWWLGSEYSGCYALSLSHPCSFAETDYYMRGDHIVWIELARPGSVAADSFEADNDAATARQFSGPQAHTFHNSGDVDWAKFIVTAEDVSANRLFYIFTTRLGLGEDTYLYLMDTDGVTELASDDDSGMGYASLVTWQFSTPGTYYVKVRPFNSNDTGYCDARYDLEIGDLSFLPFVNR